MNGQSGATAGASPSRAEVEQVVGLFGQGRYAEAEPLARVLTQRYPRHGFGWKVLGAVLKQLGRDEEALAPMQTAVALVPGDSQTHYNLGNAYKARGDGAEAEGSYRRALELNPNFVDAHQNLGNLLLEAGRFEDAARCFRAAIQIRPEFASAHCSLGRAAAELGRLSEAELSYRRAISIQPAFAEAYGGLGDLLDDQDRDSEAEACYRRAISLEPDLQEAYLNLGFVLAKRHWLTDAIVSYRRALELNPNYPEAHNNLGLALSAQGRPAEAEASCRRALELKPDFVDAWNNLLFVLNYDAERSGEEIYREYLAYDERFGLPLRGSWRDHGNSREVGRRLKVGYVSPDFRRHAVSFFLEPLLAAHDKAQVEVVAYAELRREDEVSARYKGYVDQWVPTVGLSDEALAERIRADGIDILVDVAGHTGGNRLGVFARKPAPVSVTWLGYGYTTGLSAIDYFLTDEASVPAGSEALFAETPWRVATPVYVYRPAQGMGEVAGLPAAERGYITFGTLTRAVRINHRTIRVWSEILKRVAGSKLVIDSGNFQEGAMQEALAQRFGAHGIERERLEIGYHSPPWDVLRGLDIGLDCFPHNSGTTLFETLYMGVPYVSLAARPSVGRLGSSILQGVGHPEWIAGSEEEYIDKVVELASDREKLGQTRAQLRSHMQASALMDEAGFARKVEAAYRGMWIKWSEKHP